MQRSLDGMRQAVRRPATQVVARAAARRSHFVPRRGRPRRAPSASSTFRAAPRAPWVRSAATTARLLPVVAERLFRKAGFDVVYPNALDGPVLRPAVREQGARRGGRPEVGGAGARVARGQRRRPLADRVRHQSVRVPDEDATARGTARGPGQHRVRPRHACCRASRSRPSAEPVAIHPVCSVRKMGTRRQADGDRRPLQRRGRRGRRRCCAAASPATRASTGPSSTSTPCAT